MCVIYLAFDSDPRYRLVVAANRDEFHERPTEGLQEWDGGIVAGRDLRGGGTWMGLHRDGRFAALTNFRDPAAAAAPRSRGSLVTEFLESGGDPLGWTKDRVARGGEYGGFSLFVSDLRRLAHGSNRSGRAEALGRGIYAVSNGLLGDPWPKVVRGREAFTAALRATADEVLIGRLLEVLSDATPAKEEDLPETGVGPEWERMLSPIFIRGEEYGTRASSVVLVRRNGDALFVERSFGRGGAEIETRRVELTLAV